MDCETDAYCSYGFPDFTDSMLSSYYNKACMTATLDVVLVVIAIPDMLSTGVVNGSVGFY